MPNANEPITLIITMPYNEWLEFADYVTFGIGDNDAPGVMWRLESEVTDALSVYH